MLLLQVIRNEIQIAIDRQILNRLIPIAQIRVNVHLRFRIGLCADFDELSQFGLSVDCVDFNARFIDLDFGFEEYFESIFFKLLFL